VTDPVSLKILNLEYRNFYEKKNLMVVINSRIALTVAGQSSLLASNEIVQPLRFLDGGMEKSYKNSRNITFPLTPRSI
jgi:hypothetical protein